MNNDFIFEQQSLISLLSLQTLVRALKKLQAECNTRRSENIHAAQTQALFKISSSHQSALKHGSHASKACVKMLKL